MQSQKNTLSLALYNIRSVYNVGSLFRTADGAGIEKLYLIGHTPTPIDRFGRVRSDLHKTALGAEDTVLWEYVAHWNDMEKIIKKENLCTIAIEQDPRSIAYDSIKMGEGGTLLILGNEVDGLSAGILDKANSIAEIPMYGGKNSLNVSVAGGIMMYHLTSQKNTTIHQKDL